MPNFNFEDYRQPWETGPHWALKREFMEKYQNDFPEDRLLCLAQAYSNMELLHCSYPDPVMRQIHELSKTLHECKRFREESKLKEEKRNSAQRAQKGKRSLPSEDSSKSFKFIKFCSATTATKRSSNTTESSEDITSSINPPSDSNSDYVSSKACKSMDPIDIHSSDVSDKRMENCSDFVLRIVNSPNFKEIKAIADEIKSIGGRQRPIEEIEKAVCNSNLENFVSYKFDITSIEKAPVCLCKFYIGNTLVSIGRDNNEKNARVKAAEYAIEVLSNLCNLPCKTLNDLKTFWIGENDNYPFQHKDCCKYEDGKDTNKLYLQFWLNLAQEVKKGIEKISGQEVKSRNLTLQALHLMEYSTKAAGISKLFYFNFNEELDTPLHSRIYCCNLVFEKTIVSQGKDSSKKKAKTKAAENGAICLMNLLLWYEEYFPKSGEMLGSSTVQQSLEKNCKTGLDSKCSESKEYTACTINLCDITSNNSDQGNTASLVKMITEIEANSKNKLSLKKERKKSNLQLCREGAVQQHKNIVKDEKSLSKISNNTVNLSFESQRSDNRSIHSKPFNNKLLRNSYNKQLVIFDTSDILPIHMQAPAALLNYSASFCQKKMSYITEEICSASGEIEKYRFHCLFDEETMGTGEAPIKTDAKANAALAAFQNLRKNVYTIKVKNEVEEGFIITRSQVIDGDYSTNAVSDNNIGCKMLKMMGWSGGAIGKNGGITEPIVASDNNFHRGLGFKNKSGNMRSFNQKIEALLKDFSQTRTTSDLVFAKDFSKEERKDIHKIALKLHLNSTSRGKDKNRQLFIKRKMCLNELLDLIVQAGGSTSKYEMVDCSKE